MKFADRKERRVLTNAQGIYRVFDAPPGNLHVTCGAIQHDLKIVPGRSIVHDLKLNP